MSEKLMKILILNEKISISSQKVEKLQWNFNERCDLILKVTKKEQGFTFSPGNTNLEVKEHFPRFLSFRFWV